MSASDLSKSQPIQVLDPPATEPTKWYSLMPLIFLAPIIFSISVCVIVYHFSTILFFQKFSSVLQVLGIFCLLFSHQALPLFVYFYITLSHLLSSFASICQTLQSVACSAAVLQNYSSFLFVFIVNTFLHLLMTHTSFSSRAWANSCRMCPCGLLLALRRNTHSSF